tara:strand:- start:176 stop:700 length:525 start_codon:yes stop_codon:yes gene_type:complete
MSPIDRGDGKMCIDWYAVGFDPYAFVDEIINEYQVVLGNYESEEQQLELLTTAGVNVASWMPNAEGFINSLKLTHEQGTETTRTDGGLGRAVGPNNLNSQSVRGNLSHLGFDEWIFNIRAACMSTDALASLVAHEVAHVVIGHTHNWAGPRYQQWAAGAMANQQRAGLGGRRLI